MKERIHKLQEIWKGCSKKRKGMILGAFFCVLVCAGCGVYAISDLQTKDASTGTYAVVEKKESAGQEKPDPEKKDLKESQDGKKAGADADKKADSSKDVPKEKKAATEDKKDGSRSGKEAAKKDEKKAASVSSTSSTTPKEEKKPEKQREWVEPVYETIYHPEEGHYETREVSPAYENKRIVGEYVLSNDGATFYGDDAVLQWGEYVQSKGRGSGVTSYSVQPIWETYTVPAVTEQVWVVDKAAWVENKLIKEGYYK